MGFSILFIFIMFMRFLLFLSSLHLMDAHSSSSMQHPALCHDTESAALLQFKHSFLIDERASGEPSAYPKVANWDSHTDCCAWDGVECDSVTGHVIGLHLASSCLSGSISSNSTLFTLVHLHRLDLYDNDFHGSQIPNAFGQLSRLRSLDLSFSVFSGQIPSEVLALSKLVFLDLSGNTMLRLQNPGFGNLVQNLTRLKTLDLSQVNISSTIPHALSNFSSLTSLLLEDCGLHGEFPVDIFRLPNLQYFSVWDNPELIGHLPEFQETSPLRLLYLTNTIFSGELPASIGRLSSLTELRIRSCNFTGIIPSSLGRLLQLSVLDLSFNSFNGFSGQIPSEVLALSKLVFLDLSGNTMLRLQNPGLGNLVQNLTRLQYLYLSQVNISSTIPHALSNLSSLTSLLLEDCGLHGEFPVDIFRLPNLQYLSVWDNPELIGHLPEFQETSPLRLLYLTNTSFSGELPASIGRLSYLTELRIQSCNFTGLLPSSLGRLLQLSVLDLSNNSFRGPIPNSLFELVNLHYLSLHTNNLNGTVELNKLSKLKNLTWFQLSYNNLSLLNYNDISVTLPKFKMLGLDACNLIKIPEFLQNQNELEMLGLSHNSIRGPIPKWIWNMSTQSLESLLLDHNFLTSFDPPAGLLPWSQLCILKIGSNMLQGSLPIPPPSSIYYSVRGNKLSGQIPHLMCNMSFLDVLDLSNNNLSGMIPQCLSNLSSSLSVLDLHGNNLHGSIPQTCTKISNLRMIDLSENQLQGQLPRSLANCIMLEELDLGNNRIKDIFPFWLGSLPKVQILVLSSNFLHGGIGSFKTIFGFPNLRIIDLSYNKFVGDLPLENLKYWADMKLGHASHLEYMQATPQSESPHYLWTMDFRYSMTIRNKGMLRFYKQIPDTFIAIDFSNNHFTGQIPSFVGNLKGLNLLNLGSNHLTGHIPSSLGNLTQMESLDLSMNKLSGEIPWELTSMTFLAFFNVSYNQLSGLIPQGNQFATFSNASFEGNLGLCGSPLPRQCGGFPTPSLSSKQGSNSDFDWKFVLMSYGSGLAIGVSIGYCFTSWKHEWFVKTFGRWRGMRKEKKGHRGHKGRIIEPN